MLDTETLQRTGFATHRHETEVASTMGLAAALCQRRRLDVLVTADRQTAGYGRAGREWHSAGGGLHLSLGLWQPALKPPNLYVVAAGLATLDVLDTLGAKVRLRWPNDVLATWWDGERKISGAIAEVHGGALVLGVGINVKGRSSNWPGDLKNTGVTLEDLVIPAEPTEILQAWLSAFRRLEKDRGGLVPAFRRRCGTLGRRVEVQLRDRRLTGLAKTLTEEGFLVVEEGGIGTVLEDCLLLREL
ncbi:MAG TPA: biotin--[acetyl-CoA-carboxylase] ligase [Thermoplasmata archaeon]|nr:biotin--[acetyl-CoA-carboxylase] ligase [Thermoplasmata archaeon]